MVLTGNQSIGWIRPSTLEDRQQFAFAMVLFGLAISNTRSMPPSGFQYFHLWILLSTLLPFSCPRSLTGHVQVRTCFVYFLRFGGPLSVFWIFLCPICQKWAFLLRPLLKNIWNVLYFYFLTHLRPQETVHYKYDSSEVLVRVMSIPVRSIGYFFSP